MRKIKWITLGVPLVLCLCGLFAGPAPPQECSTYDDKPNCDTYNVITGICYAKADCQNLEAVPCGAQQVEASIVVPSGYTCSVGTGYNGECGPGCGGYAWAAPVKKGVELYQVDVYCCSGCN
ncbi:MAG TPA: hypothetical protein VEO19_16135 [Terriglobia bacterium]|nr:hypothetical protein [Terriglobia bacterium]